MRQGLRAFAIAGTVVVALAGVAAPSWAGPGGSNNGYAPGSSGYHHDPNRTGGHYGSPPVSVEIIAPIAPPPPRAEVRPHPPGPFHLFVWVPGHWSWERGHYVWVSGHWDRSPHRGAAWVEGHWAPRHHQWVWIPGHWR